MSSATVTVLFTDLVSSTAHASRLDAAGADALRQTHFALLRGAVGTTGGIEVKNLGDGLMVVFTSPSRALACAVAMQQAMERHNHRAEIQLEVRIGLSAGEAVEEDGDYFGDPVVEAARLCAVADGGQILATDLVRLLVGRHATQPLRRVGDLTLKGLPHPVATVEVAWEPEGDSDSDGAGVPLPARLVAGGADLFAFFGRGAELDVLWAAVKRCSTDESVHAVFVSGEPGIGKSTLAAQAGRSAHGEGAIVTHGGCEEGVTLPYQPWVTAVSHLLTHAPDDVFEALAPVHAAALARLVPAHAGRFGAASTGGAGSDEEERFALMESVTGLLAELSHPAPVLVLLDDLQWADVATLQLLRHVLVSPVPARLLVIATYRDSDLSRGHPLTGLLADLWRESRVERLALDGLGDDDIVDLMTAAAGQDVSDEGVRLAHAVRRETDGNPFFVTELLRHLGESGGFVLDDNGHYNVRSGENGLSLPSSVRDVVARRVERLGEDAIHVLSLAAVAGRDFRLDVLALASERDEDDMLDLLEAATAAAIVAEDAPGRYRFVHALIQHTLYDDLSATRRQRWHHRVADALEAAGASDAELARHWLAATGPTDFDKAVDYAVRAGDQALTALAPDDAARWYQQALELLDRGPVPDADRRCTALLGLAEAQVSAGDPDYVGTTLEAGRLAAQLGDTDRLARAVLASRSTARVMLAPDVDLLALVETALDAVGPEDSALRGHLLTVRFVERDPRDPDRVDDAQEALAIADRLGDEQIWLACVVDALTGLAAPWTHGERLAWGPRLRRAAASAHPRLRMGGAMTELYALIEAGDIDAADEVIAHMEALAEEEPLVLSRHIVLMVRSLRRLLAGDRLGAQTAADEGLELGTRFSIPVAATTYGGLAYRILFEFGGLEALVEPFEQIVAENPNVAVMRVGLARTYCALGRFEDAAALLERDVANDLVEVAQGATWLVAHIQLAETAVDVGNKAAARLLRERLAPYEHLVGYSLATIEGCTAGPLARIAAMLGEKDTAARLFDVAVDVHRRMRAPYWTARVLLDRVDAGLGAAGDREEARGIAERFGYAPLLARLEGREGRPVKNNGGTAPR